MNNPNSVLHVTVTSAEGQPRMQLPGDISMEQLKRQVRNRFGFQTPGGAVALPHSFCARLEPPPAHVQPCEIVAEVPFLMRRGHNRVV